MIEYIIFFTITFIDIYLFCIAIKIINNIDMDSYSELDELDIIIDDPWILITKNNNVLSYGNAYV